MKSTPVPDECSVSEHCLKLRLTQNEATELHFVPISVHPATFSCMRAIGFHSVVLLSALLAGCGAPVHQSDVTSTTPARLTRKPNATTLPASSLCSPEEGWNHCSSTDFTTLDSFPGEDWKISTWGSENRRHSIDNVRLVDQHLQLRVDGGTPAGETTTGAEISTRRVDYLYGSFRAVVKIATEPGTVLGWFYYLGDESEIDIELLSKFDEEQLVHFTIHKNIGPETHQEVVLGFRPSEGFHEYRFDWFEDRVKYFVDNQLMTTFRTNVPHQPGRILLNHWTRSSDLWGGGPPANDAIAEVRSIEIYENR